MFDPKRILVLAPHTDDGELGCGGSIAKFIADGKEVCYAAFSSCAASLPAGLAADTLINECKAATAFLGITEKNIYLFDFPVREFTTHRQEILEELIQLNKQVSPDLVLLPAASDNHQDHQVIHQEGLRAFRKSTLLGYELPWNQRHAHQQLFIRLTEKEIEKKNGALKMYASQAHRNYMQENFTRSLATVRGVQANADFAEAFEIYRSIW
jgi:LmbE family N-acetylglucosaminyl deacetylase